jgi:hypothetical protein
VFALIIVLGRDAHTDYIQAVGKLIIDGRVAQIF